VPGDTNGETAFTEMSSMSLPSSEIGRLIRHLLAAIAYRASRPLRDAPVGFEHVRASDDSMSAGELVRHMTNVLAFAVATATGTDRVRHEPLDWEGEVRRFYGLLGSLDALFAGGAHLEPDMELKLVQGPFADALTHIGQLNALRRKAGAPIGPESYIRADIRIGRVGLDEQA
jgi:hypothetical protein